MAERKVEVEINGRVKRVQEHMVEDMLRFGASLKKREIKNPPKELLNMPAPKKVILPEDKLPEPQDFPSEPVAEVKAEVAKKKIVKGKK